MREVMLKIIDQYLFPLNSLKYLITQYIDPFLEVNDIIAEYQHGFRTCRYTNSAVYSFYESKFIDVGTCPFEIFCDPSRAIEFPQIIYTFITRKHMLFNFIIRKSNC